MKDKMSNDRELLNKTLKQLIDLSLPNFSAEEIVEKSDRIDEVLDRKPEKEKANFWDGIDYEESRTAENTRAFLKEHFDIDINNPDLNASLRLLEVDPKYYDLIKIVNGNSYEEVLSKLNAKSKLLKQIG